MITHLLDDVYLEGYIPLILRGAREKMGGGQTGQTAANDRDLDYSRHLIGVSSASSNSVVHAVGWTVKKS